jgi:hypothetical protein
VSAVPAGDREMELHMFFFGPSGGPTDPKEVTATLRLPDQDLGPLPVTLQGMGVGMQMGTIAVPVGMQMGTIAVPVPVPGDWTLTVSARTKDVTLPIR